MLAETTTHGATHGSPSTPVLSGIGCDRIVAGQSMFLRSQYPLVLGAQVLLICRFWVQIPGGVPLLSSTYYFRVSGSRDIYPMAAPMGYDRGMCNHANRERAMVVLARDDDGVPTVWCDPCIAPIVKALNDGGLPTVASCCGHGTQPGNIALRDGRELIIHAPA